MLEPLPFLQTAAAGALAALWGFAVAVLVRRHLVALFVVPATLGAAVPLASVLPTVASWLPLPVLIGAVGIDPAVIGADPAAIASHDHSALVAAVVVAAWLVLAASSAVVRFLTRDIT